MKKYKWVCECSDGGYHEDSEEDYGKTFSSQEECYEDMRHAAVGKILWNTDWNDVTEDCEPYEDKTDGLTKTEGRIENTIRFAGKDDRPDNWCVGYRIEFHPHMIQHESFSGIYTYKIVVVDDGNIPVMTPEIAESNNVVAAACCAYCKHCRKHGDNWVCQHLGCHTFDTDVCDHYEQV